MIPIESVRESVYSSPILVADDVPMIRKLIGSILSHAGFEHIEYAENGLEVMEKIPTFRPVCIILDVEMPVLDGNEALKKIRSNPETADIPVIVITGHDEREERNKILRSGASNLISKPIDADILIERLVNLLEKKHLTSKLSEFHDRLSSELAYASEMQTDMMPTEEEKKKVENRYGVSLASHFRPSSELGGDAWFLQEIDDNKFGVMLVDFSGHGISAALNTVRIHSITSRLDVNPNSPAQYMEAINSEISKILPVEQYCTSLYMVVDVKTGKIRYSGAAAPPPMYGLIEHREVMQGDGSGLPIGITPDAKYVDHEIEFPKGSFIFLYSDALYETELENNVALEIEGVEKLVITEMNSNAAKALSGILSSFGKFAPDPLPDDLTTIWLSY